MLKRDGEPHLLLVVDDEPTMLASLNDSLRSEFKTRVANNGERALAMALMDPPPDLILLDVEMPGLDGYQVCKRLKDDARTRDIPVIFLSGHRNTVDVTHGLDLGAVDYMAKPVAAPILRARVRGQIRLSEDKRGLLEQNHVLEALVDERTAALQRQTEAVLKTQETTIFALGALAETRDNETGFHIRRTQGYVQVLCDALYTLPSIQSQYDASTFSLIWKSAPLHDIGKVGIPDSILLKPGKLTDEEFDQMKLHTVLGRKALGLTEDEARSGQSFLAIASQIACYHHEKWNGRGYPEGLSGDGIPLPARMMAVADVYDALVSARVYKAAMSHEKAVGIIVADRGTHFDPNLVDCFTEHAEKFRAIAHHYAEP